MAAGDVQGTVFWPRTPRRCACLLFLLIVMAASCAGCFGPYPRDFDARYAYHLSITTSDPVTNATFVVPLPVRNHAPQIGALVLNESQFLQYSYYTLNRNINSFRVFTARDAGYPPDFRFSVISMDNGTFLRLDADTFRPEQPVNVWFTYEIEPSVSYLDIDTISPLAHEPVFLPKDNYSRDYRGGYFSRRSFGGTQNLISQTAAEYSYNIPVYAGYATENRSTAVTVISYVSGTNHWIRGYDLHGYNSYKDSYSFTFNSTMEGWVPARGSLVLADGDYPAENAPVLPEGPPVGWEQVTGNAGFSPRINHDSLVYHDRLWVIGGETEDGMVKNDVWYSDEGRDWVPATMRAGFAPRSGFCSVVFNDTMWVIGGRAGDGGYVPENSMYKNDAWYSSDGTTWKQATARAAFPGRSGHQCVVFNNLIWVIGGTAEQDFVSMNRTFANGTHTTAGKIGRVNFSDIWYSADGVNWVPATQNAGFGERVNHRAAVFRDRMWVINGEGHHDIWSSGDGRTWTRVNPDPPFNYANMTLEKFGILVFDDRLWVIGGEISGASSIPSWYSVDGISWTALYSARPLDYRWEHSVAVFRDHMWLIGGRDALSRTYRNDVWYTPGSMDFEPIKAPWEK